MKRRRSPSRRELLNRKRRLQEEINEAVAEVRSLQSSQRPTAEAEARLAKLRDEFVRTRLAIDQAPPDN